MTFAWTGNHRFWPFVAVNAAWMTVTAEGMNELTRGLFNPAESERSDYVEAGGLVSYAASDAEQYRRAATYVDKILKGAKPANLPSSSPRNSSWRSNLKTAKYWMPNLRRPATLRSHSSSP